MATLVTPAALASRAAPTHVRALVVERGAACSKLERKRRIAKLAAFTRQMATSRRSYFKHHRSARVRRAFVRKQISQLKSLKRAVSSCKEVPPPEQPPAADLALTLAAPGPVPLGANATYVATVKNKGPDAATAVSVTEAADSSMTFRSASSSQGSCSAGGSPKCDLGTLGVGASATVTYVVTPAHANANTVTAVVGGAESDPDPSNDKASLSIQVVDSADLVVDGASSPSSAFAGQRITESIGVTNRGSTRAADAVQLANELPSGLQFLYAVPSRGSCAGGATVHCDVGSLAPGERASVTVFAKAISVGTQTSSVSVNSSTPDPSPANNTLGLVTQLDAPPVLTPSSTGPPCSPTVATTGNTTPYTEGSATDYTYFLQPQGAVHTLMIFVDFSDAPQSGSTQTLYDALAPPAVQWYTDGSYGRVTLAVDGVNTWFRMPKTSTDYGLADSVTGATHRAYIADAIAAADSAVNFSGYSIVYIVPSAGAAIGPSAAYTDNPGSGIPADGGEIRHAVTFSPHSLWPGTMEHETGHLFGLPDLYQYGVPYNPGGVTAVGTWDPMSEHSPDIAAQFSGWHKFKFGWLDASQVRCVSTSGRSFDETLSPLESASGVKLLVVPTGATTATVVEVRDPLGADAALCDSGVLVYAVDGSVRSGQVPFRVRRLGTGADAKLSSRCGPPYDAPLDLGPGEVSTYEDAAVKVEVLATDGASYRVRVTKK